MGIFDNFLEFIKNGKELEKLKEAVEVQKQLLDNSGNVTIPSSLAREQRERKDQQGLVLKRVPIKELQLLYLNNQLVFRGVNIRADELINRGYELVGGDEAGRKLCEEIIENSGSENLFWQLSVNTDVAGDGYLEKVWNGDGTKLVMFKHVNPINFGFLTHGKNNEQIVINEKTGKPLAYMQTVYDNEGKETRIQVDIDKIAHLKFNTFGDEFNGISSLQPLYNTALRLMNMENAAAEAAVKTANPTWVVYTDSKSPRDLGIWASTLGRISAKEVVFLPKNVKTDLKSPGNQNFSAYSDYFMNSVVSALGVPKSILTGTGESSGGNRATVQTLSKHFYSVIRSNQRYVSGLFNKIFEDYGKLVGFKAPELVFTDIAEDADRNGQRAVELYGAGLITLEEARETIGLETNDKIKKELEESNKKSTSNMAEDAEMKRSDREAHFPAKPGSPAGSQKGEKKSKKFDPNVPSVK